VLVAGVLLKRRTLGRRLEVLEADLALDALGREVLWMLLVLTEVVSGKRNEKTYGFQLRFGDRTGVLFAVALGSCFCAVAHGC
jgi:hypothetical protein